MDNPLLNKSIVDCALLEKFCDSTSDSRQPSQADAIEAEARQITDQLRVAPSVMRLSLAAQVLQQINMAEFDVSALIYCTTRTFDKHMVNSNQPLLVMQVKDCFALFFARWQRRDLKKEFMGKLAAGVLSSARKQVAMDIANKQLSTHWALDGEYYAQLVPAYMNKSDVKIAIENWVAVAPIQRMGYITQDARDYVTQRQSQGGSVSPLADYYFECLEERENARTDADNRRPDIPAASRTARFKHAFR